MFLYASPTHHLTLCPSTPAPYTPSPRERYIDALAKLRAAEASYLSFKAAEREEEALTHRLRELQLHRQRNRLRTPGQYFSEDAYLTDGLNNFGAYQEDYPYIISVAEPQALKAGHDCCCCDGLVSSMYPCMYCSDTSGIELHPVSYSSFDYPNCKVAPSTRLKPRTRSSLNNVDHFTGVKLPLAESQSFTPTPSFSGCRRGARSLRRPEPHALQHPFFMGRYGLQDEEQLKNLQYPVPFCRASPLSERYLSERMSDDIHGHQTNGSMQCTPETVPSRAETPHECNIPMPDTETTPAPEGEFKLVSSVPPENASTEGGLDIPVSTTTTISTANPSTADHPAETASSSSSTETASSTETTSSTEITSSFDKIRTIEATFNALKENFTLPVELDFLRSTTSSPSTPSMSDSDSDTESVSATDHLTYSPLNRSVRSYEQALTVLLEQLDGVESLGDEDVRKRRRDVVKRIELALEELERKVDGQWRISVMEPLANGGKSGGETEDHGSVLGLGLDNCESEKEQEDDTQKEDYESDDSADVVSSPPHEIIEQNDTSSANTTVNTSDNLSAQIYTTPVHDNNPIQAPIEDQLKFSDTNPVADIIPPADVTDSDPSPIPIACTGDTQRVLSISSASSVVDPTPITPSNAIIRDQEPPIPVDIPPKSAVEPSTPSSPEPSSTTSENAGLPTLQDADIEPEGFFLTSSGADESVSEHPIVRDSDEEWLEVDA